MATRARKALAHRLPQFIPPMLAKPGVAFDSDEHLFEVKWDLRQDKPGKGGMHM